MLLPFISKAIFKANKIRNFLLLIILNFAVLSKANAQQDLELMQSLKCVNFFHYYEKKYGIPKDTLLSISLNETGKLHSSKKFKMSWPWVANIHGEGVYFESKREAVQYIKRQIREGKQSIDIGCMQVNIKHHPSAFKSIEHAFDPRYNIDYAAKFLLTKYQALGSWHKAIAHYHSATPELGNKYKNNVVKIAANIESYKEPFKNLVMQRKFARNTFAYNYSKVKPQLVNSNYRARKYRSNMMIYVPRSTPNSL